MSSEDLKFSRFIPGLFWSYLIVLLLVTIIPTSILDTGDIIMNNYSMNFRADYLLHPLAYIPLPVLLWVYTSNRSVFIFQMRLKGIFLISFIIASGLEFFQILIPFRAFNLLDLTGNIGGVILGSMMILVFKNNRIFTPSEK